MVVALDAMLVAVVAAVVPEAASRETVLLAAKETAGNRLYFES